MPGKSIRVITLGCSKNTVDSEYLITQLKHQGFNVESQQPQKNNPSIVIVNTCGFINDAKQESIDTILEYAHAKKSGIIDDLIVTGCLSQRYPDELKEEIPEADAFFGTGRLAELLEYLGAKYNPEVQHRRMTSTPDHYAYLKIAEGCNRKCSFCAIPLIRGPHVSMPERDVLAEAGHLASKGVKELLLISQDLGYYGKDLPMKTDLVSLLRSLVKINGPEWIRLHYLYPSEVTDELLHLIGSEEKICNYIDIPVQHISNRILKSMSRGHDKRYIYQLLERIRSKLPGAAIRTTLITGYPGETEEEFNELMDFVKDFRFDRLGVFAYSHEEGTPAGRLPDSVPESIKMERMETLMDLQQGISLELNRKKAGSIYRVIIDGKEGKYYTGRTEFDSPEVDNEVLIPDHFSIRPGNFYNVKITDADYFDLFGVIS